MKIIDAFWEKRNLGVKAVEVCCEAGDRADELERVLSAQIAPYQVLKIPPGKIELSRAATRAGYVFMETQVETFRPLGDFRREDWLKGELNKLAYKEMDSADRRELDEELAKGMFTTDRIALDPRFSVPIANRRYKNWLDDAISKDAALYKITLANDAIGFFAIRDVAKNSCSAFLCGLYSASRGKGLGGAAVLCPLIEGSLRGRDSHESWISLNNPPILNLHLKYGARVRTEYYVFVRFGTP